MRPRWRSTNAFLLTMSVVNENLIRDVVAEVLSRLGQRAAPGGSNAPSNGASCGSDGNRAATVVTSAGTRGKFGVFQDANEACQAAQESFAQLQKKGVEARRKIESLESCFLAATSAEPCASNCTMRPCRAIRVTVPATSLRSM